MGVNHSHLSHQTNPDLSFVVFFFFSFSSPCLVRPVRRDILCCLRSVRTAPLLCFSFFSSCVCVCRVCTLCCFRILSYWAYIFFFSFSFVEICLDCLPFVSNPPFLQHPVPVEISVAWGTSTHTLKKLTRKKKIEEQKKKKRKEKKKSFMISIAFLRNCQTCIHTDPDATRSSTYTLPPPPHTRSNQTLLHFLVWPAWETHGFFHENVYIYVARQRLSFSKTKEKEREKERKGGRAHLLSPQPRLYHMLLCGGRENEHSRA